MALRKLTTVYIGLPNELYEYVREMAELNNRTISNMLTLIVKKGLGYPATTPIIEPDYELPA